MSWNPEEHYKSQDVAIEYDMTRFSSVSGRVFNGWEQRVIAKCFSGVTSGQTIVDVPCGTGRLAEKLLALGYRVHGIDISGPMLDVAKQRLQEYGDRFTCEVADVKKISGGNRQYDAALCARILMHFPLDQQIAFLAAVASLSRSTVVINQSLDSGYQRMRRRVKRILGNQVPARYPVSNADICTLLQGAGLREAKRRRLLPAISEAVYIITEKVV